MICAKCGEEYELRLGKAVLCKKCAKEQNGICFGCGKTLDSNDKERGICGSCADAYKERSGYTTGMSVYKISVIEEAIDRREREIKALNCLKNNMPLDQALIVSGMNPRTMRDLAASVSGEHYGKGEKTIDKTLAHATRDGANITALMWPDNLIADVIGIERLCEIQGDHETHLMEAIDQISSERTRRILILYYRDLSPLDEIAAEYGVTRERIRQILVRGIRLLRTPKDQETILIGRRAMELAKQIREEEALAEKKLKLNELLTENANAHPNDTKVRACADAVKIEELGLSARSYNCLHRYWFDTVGDVIRFGEAADGKRDPARYLTIRGFGRKSIMETRDVIFERFRFDILKECDASESETAVQTAM